MSKNRILTPAQNQGLPLRVYPYRNFLQNSYYSDRESIFFDPSTKLGFTLREEIMQHIELNLTIRQADLVLASLRNQLRELNHSLNNDVLSSAESIDIQSSANVVRSTMQVLKDLIYKAERA